MRAVPEWHGATDDAKIPDRVKLRIWIREGGKCHLTGRRILPSDAYEFEHVIELCNGGKHCESNIKLALKGKEHKAKTAAALKQRARSDKAVKRLAGIKKPRTITRWRKFNGEIVEAPRER